MYWMAPPTLMRKLAHPDESADFGPGSPAAHLVRSRAPRWRALTRLGAAASFRAARRNEPLPARQPLQGRTGESLPCP
jgi:hypothetical protein